MASKKRAPSPRPPGAMKVVIMRPDQEPYQLILCPGDTVDFSGCTLAHDGDRLTVLTRDPNHEQDEW